MKRTHTYTAEDGTTFATAEECKKYENGLIWDKLIELTLEDINRAFNRANIPLADAIERAGNIIAAKRRGSGELKRGKKTDAFEGVAKAMEEKKL